MFETIKNLTWAITKPKELQQIRNLDTAINWDSSIDRTNDGQDNGYSISLTDKGRYIKVSTGKRSRYISNDSCGFYIYNNDIV